MSTKKTLMRKSTFIFCLFAVIILISCKKEVKNYTLGIDVQSQFENDSVEVFLDNEVLIKKRLSTNNLVGVCTDGIIRTTKTTGNHALKIIINNTSTLNQNFTINKDVYIGINFDPSTHAISVVYADDPFLYE